MRMPELTQATAKIVINERPPFAAPTGRSLLATLKQQGIFIPSACGGHGICGLCQVKVRSGAGAYTSREAALLGKADRQAGMRLACQITVQRDLLLGIPNDFFNIREYKAEVIALRELTPDIREITLQLLSPPAIDFKAGQYIQLRIPPYENSPRTLYRAYSIASSPSVHGRLELEIRRVLNGIGTTYIFQKLKVHTHVIFNGPYGDFYLRDSSRPIVLIAGGSGMAPMKAMLAEMQEHNIHRIVRYFFGACTRRDLFLVDEMQALERSLPDFRFIPALSQPLPDDQWTGETGQITDVLDRHMDTPYHGETYLCGSPAMIQAAVTILKKKGVAKERIFYDTFG